MSFRNIDNKLPEIKNKIRPSFGVAIIKTIKAKIIPDNCPDKEGIILLCSYSINSYLLELYFELHLDYLINAIYMVYK